MDQDRHEGLAARSVACKLAPAKLNLTLNIVGRRDDGYHNLKSLVVFARDIYDEVHLEATTAETVHPVSFQGPFAKGLDRKTNSVSCALTRLKRAGVTFDAQTSIRVEKRIPVAGGLGGGSVNAAAVLRHAQQHGAGQMNGLDWVELARDIGADVPVCLASRAQVMCGTGDILQAVDGIPELFGVIVNTQAPTVPDKTKRVFTAYADRMTGAAEGCAPQTIETNFETAEAVADLVRMRGNELRPAALSQIPGLARALEALQAQSDCLAAEMTGAGPSVFGLFNTSARANSAAQDILHRQPDWWVRASRLV